MKNDAINSKMNNKLKILIFQILLVTVLITVIAFSDDNEANEKYAMWQTPGFLKALMLITGVIETIV